MDRNLPIEFVVVPLVFAVLIVVIVIAYLERSRRERYRLELQKAVLERVGSVKDLAEFLTTEQGDRFLTTLAPSDFRPQHRGLWAVRVGIVLLTIGLFLMVGLHVPFGLRGQSQAPVLLLGVLLLIAAGVACCDVARVFAELKPRERALLWLAYVEEDTHAEIADSLRLGRGSIKVLLSRARARLRDLLRARGIGEGAGDESRQH